MDREASEVMMFFRCREEQLLYSVRGPEVERPEVARPLAATRCFQPPDKKLRLELTRETNTRPPARPSCARIKRERTLPPHTHYHLRNLLEISIGSKNQNDWF